MGALTLERWDLPKLAEILVGNGQRFRVLDVVPFEEEDESPFVRMLRSRRRRPASGRQVQCRLAYCSASRREAHSCMSLILPSRNVITTGLLSVGTPSAPIQCAEPMTLSSAIWVSERWLIFQPPLVFKTSRASFGPRQEGACFHQRWPRETPRHSASSAKSEASGSGSP